MEKGGRSHSPELPGYEILRRINRGDAIAGYLATDADGHRVECLVAQSSEAKSPVVDAPGEPDVAHPHLAELLDVVQSAGGESAVVIDYLQGGTLSALVRAVGALSLGQVITVMEPIASAVGFVHEQGFCHSAVSAEYIFVAASGLPKILGPAAVRALGVGSGETADAGRRADVRALGALAWTLLTGHEPPVGRIRPPIRVYHPELPERLVEAIEDPAQFTAAGFAETVHTLAVSEADAAPAPLRLVRTDAREPSSDALTAQLRLSAGAGRAGAGPPTGAEKTGEERSGPRPAAGRLAGIGARQRRRGRHRRRGRRALVWPAVAAVLACAVAVTAFMVGAGESSGPEPTGPEQIGNDKTLAAEPAGARDHTPSAEIPAHIGAAAASAKPLRAVTGLVWIRADMFGNADRSRLELLDAPHSTAWREDAGKLRTLRRAGSKLEGLHMSLLSAERIAQSSARAVVAVTVKTSAYRQVDDAGHTIARKAAAIASHRLTLVRRDGRWLISAVR
ncbi:protein kinase [Spelaeicoccus albus]|uniref:Protein kinase domain-containing protein n=1 Tax=Spelaeicoccus albus TaxID=1280376 RepID=A0A7Z0IID0_9MICO|nr:protein kinase [Spelaeicoccus albus]NYI68329.1 hypothetical protein [Spelaeicoccus albus]